MASTVTYLAQQVPKEVLQGIQPFMELQDLRSARLACKEWAAELAGQVESVQLPPELWQQSAPKQAESIRRLTKTFWSFKAAHLIADSGHPVDSAVAEQALALLASTPTLEAIHAHGLTLDSDYAALLAAVRQLGPRLQRLGFADVELPSPSGLDGISQLTGHLQALSIHTLSSRPLHAGHLGALAQLKQLKQLELSFRAVRGSLLNPLHLDPLCQLTSLTSLELHYTGAALPCPPPAAAPAAAAAAGAATAAAAPGMPELTSGFGFSSSAEPLKGLSSLERLVVRGVPLASCKGLAACSRLQQLVLEQVEQLSEACMRSISQCTSLRSLQLDPLPLELLPAVAPLTELQQLRLQLWTPAHGGQYLPASSQLATLTGLAKLQELTLTGAIVVSEEDVALLSTTMEELRTLVLSVLLPDGSGGFPGFRQLQQLVLKPQRLRRSAVDGSSLRGSNGSGSSSSVRLRPQELPPRLVDFYGEGVVFEPATGTAAAAAASAADGDEAALAAAAAVSAAAAEGGEDLPEDEHRDMLPEGPLTLRRTASAGPSPQLRSLSLKRTGSSSDPLVLPDFPLLSDLESADLEHPELEGEHLQQLLGQACGSLKALRLSALEPHMRPVLASSSSSSKVLLAGPGKVLLGPAGRRGFSLASYHHQRSRSGGSSSSGRAAAAPAAAPTVAAAAGTIPAAASWPRAWLPGMAALGASLPNLGGLWSSSSAAASGVYSSAGAPLAKAQGLAALGCCQGLEELTLEVGDKVLDAKARAAVAELQQLRVLTLAVATDTPLAVAREYLGWLGSLRGLRRLRVGLIGPGGCEEGEQGLVEGLRRLMPFCEVERL